MIHEGSVYVAWMRVRCIDWKTGNLNWEGGTVGDPVTLGDLIAARAVADKLGMDRNKVYDFLETLEAFGSLSKFRQCLKGLEALGENKPNG